jgi:hypothetical protein
VVAGDELEAIADRPDGQGHDQAAQLDRGGE